MMIDNSEQLKKLMKFTKEGDFYMIHIFLRKKDQPESTKNSHQSVRTIKSYCIESLKKFDERYEEIKNLCEFFGARAYFSPQRKNHKDVTFEMLTNLAEKMKSEQYNQKNIFDSAVGSCKSGNKVWVVDIDTENLTILLQTKKLIDSLKPHKYESKIIETIPTKSGYHLITEKFDLMEFNKKNKHSEIEIKKNNPTLLYYPNSLNKAG